MPRGAKPGERRGGRKSGIPNKVTRDLKEIASSFTEEAILKAVAIMRRKTAPASAQLSAITIILERGHGKPAQAHHHSGAVGHYDLSRVSDDALRQLEDILGPASAPIGDPGGDSEA